VEEAGQPNVALIIFDVTTAEGKKGGGICTGTLITPTKILTAAHCVLPPSGSKLSNYRVTFDSKPSKTSTLIKVTGAVAHAGWSRDNLENGLDAAVLTLATPVQGVTPAPVVKSIPQGLVGMTATAVGYGLADYNDPNSSMIKRSVNIKV